MKVRISATIDKETDKILDDLVKKGVYRNKSHVIEDLIKKTKEVKNDKNKR